MGKVGKVMLVSTGVFLGMVFLGINISLFHFNRLVEPRNPVYLLDWRVDNNSLEIYLLGERFFFSLDNKMRFPGGVGERASNMVNRAREEAQENLAAIKSKLEKWEWMVPDIKKFLMDYSMLL